MLSHIRKALYKRVEVLVKISVIGLNITGVLEMRVPAGEREDYKYWATTNFFINSLSRAREAGLLWQVVP